MAKLPLRTLILLHLDLDSWKTGRALKRDIRNSTFGKMGFFVHLMLDSLIYNYLQQLEGEDLVRTKVGTTSDDDLTGLEYRLTYAGDDERKGLLHRVTKE